MGLLADFIYVERVRIWSSSSGPYFPAFGLDTERYGVFLRIQSECEKIGTRETPNTDIFHAFYIFSIMSRFTTTCISHFKKKTYIFQADITLYFDTLEYSVAFAKSIRNVFRTQSNIYNRVFLAKTVNCF